MHASNLCSLHHVGLDAFSMREALGTIHIALLHLIVNQIVKTISFSLLLPSLRQRVLVLEYSFLHNHANLNPSHLSFVSLTSAH